MSTTTNPRTIELPTAKFTVRKVRGEDEYVIAVTVDGIRVPERDYYTGDKDDAFATMRVMAAEERDLAESDAAIVAAAPRERVTRNQAAGMFYPVDPTVRVITRGTLVKARGNVVGLYVGRGIAETHTITWQKSGAAPLADRFARDCQYFDENQAAIMARRAAREARETEQACAEIDLGRSGRVTPRGYVTIDDNSAPDAPRVASPEITWTAPANGEPRLEGTCVLANGGTLRLRIERQRDGRWTVRYHDGHAWRADLEYAPGANLPAGARDQAAHVAAQIEKESRWNASL